MSLYRIAAVLLTAVLLNLPRGVAAQICEVPCNSDLDHCVGSAIGHEQLCEFSDCADVRAAVPHSCSAGLFSPSCLLAIARLRRCEMRCRAEFVDDLVTCRLLWRACENGTQCPPTRTATRTSTPTPQPPSPTPTETPTPTPMRVAG